MRTINNFFKRIFDFVLSLAGLIILSPFFIIISILIRKDGKGSIFFKQKRVGKNSKEFLIYKFRTMVPDAERLGTQITIGKDNRITRVGAFLIKYKLDELPQLINVLVGEMSLVGPRPEVPRYVNMYSEEQRKVLLVRPGITDLASIRYKDENDLLGSVEDPEQFYINTIMPDKLKLNLEYIEKSNIFLDLFIILKTIAKCF
ncbi:MAG: sugar transferase [Clostridiaceae bacterium]